MNTLGYAFMIMGAAFCFLGGLGILRMPDVYNRIQAGTKAVTLGSIAVLLGVGILQPDWWPKLVVLAGFIQLTSPVGASAIARALLRVGVQPWTKRRESDS
jgi:multicomponent Na+:H+ antiporter subunit G